MKEGNRQYRLQIESPEERQEIAQLRIERLRDILQGRARDKYSDWMLRGQIGEKFNPKLIIGAFPAVVDDDFIGMELAGFSLGQLEVSEAEYLKDILETPLPDRGIAREFSVFGSKLSQGNEVLNSIAPILLQAQLPVASVVLSRPSEEVEPSIYLFSPSLVPHSVSLDFLKQALAQRYNEISTANEPPRT